MAQTFNILPSGDVENDGWTLVAGSATNVWEVLSNFVDNCHVRCPSYRGGLEVSFPTDVTDLPDGAIIDSVTVLIKMQTNAGSGARGVTVNVLSADNRSRYTTRTIYATSTLTEYEVGTYTKDPLGRAWDIHRLNKLRLRIFSYNNLADSVRVYTLYCRINYHTRPTVTITSPTGTVNTPSPTVKWAYTQLEGEPQKAAEYKIFTLQQAAASTFSADTAPPVYASTTSGIANTFVLPTSLNNNDYVVCVRTQSQYGAWSTWAQKQFTVSAPAPGVPGDNNAGVAGTPGVGVPTVVADNYTSSAAIRMTDSSNLLSVQGADFEIASDPIPYQGSNCTLTRDTSQAFGSGLASLKMTATSTSPMAAMGNYQEIAPSMPLTLRGQFLAGSAGRTVNLYAAFYDADYNALGGTTIMATGTDATSTWTEIVANGTSPATAKYVVVIPEVVGHSVGEAHYVDHLGLMYGTNTAWSDGGHSSRNLLTAFLATGDDPASATDAWVQANSATTLSRVATSGVGAHGAKTNRMTYVGVSPSIAYRATSTVWNSSTTGKDFTLNKPVGLADNDLMLAFVTSTENGTINPPSGWALANTASIDDGTTDIALYVLKRTGLASDPTSWSTGTLSVNSSRRTAVVVAYSGAAHADDQFVADATRTDSSGNVTHQTASVVNTDPNAWRVAAFAASDNVTGGAFTASTQPPSQAPGISYVGKATMWSTSSSSSSFTINKPTGVQSGDLMLATVIFSGIVTPSTPSGWTQVQLVKTATSGDYGDGYLTAVVYRRTAGASESNSWSASYSGSTTYPKISQVVAYRNVDTSVGGGILAFNYNNDVNKSSIGTGSVTNTNSNAWRVCMFGAVSGTGTTWNGGDVLERADDKVTSNSFDAELSVSDSNGSVGTGSHSRTASLNNQSYKTAFGFIALLRPLSAPPAGSSETERVDTRTGSSNPWETVAVYDSNGTVAKGTYSLYGSFTSSDGAADSMASWIGFIKPATATRGGQAAAYPNTMIDISNVDDEVFNLADNKLTLMATFMGSTSGTPTLTAEFYRANMLIGTQSATGNSFDTAGFTKSWAVFDIPAGTTRIRPVLSALDRAVNDTVDFDRVAVMLGALDSPDDEPMWRNGTARPEHPVWSKPIIQYQENDGTGWGDWKTLPGQKALPPAYDLGSGQMSYVDHTIVPNFSRRYRVSTLSYGLNGDIFSSGFGPASNEVTFESRAWWLKDIQDLSKNMQITVRWKDQQVTKTNMATQFQPIGSQYPVVITEGFKGDTFSLEIHCEQQEFTQLLGLLNSGRTLILQSDIDSVWWVRPIGNIETNILATGSRVDRPRRYVTVTFVEVAPEE